MAGEHIKPAWFAIGLRYYSGAWEEYLMVKKDPVALAILCVVMPPGAATHKQQIAAECAALEARINQLDAMARQPQTAATQDWIRSERKIARDPQFELKC